MRNKRVVVARYGGPEVITVVDENMPTPKAGEVRVKVLAAGSACRTCWRARASILKRHACPTHPDGTLLEPSINSAQA